MTSLVEAPMKVSEGFSSMSALSFIFGTLWRPRSRRGSCQVWHFCHTSGEPPNVNYKDIGNQNLHALLAEITLSDNFD